ncbi:pyridoxal-dependent decarboxylase [Catenaria anguillulae PL171]|uniref:ornithine decarboxylase n=1 Tax=Catenaria anguillulae PL171 TaxID=765915 RepID=A0A1Y2HI57_9FUNG|nr:pyridoxal-dependent decarboxylase [Catenaria anguillulae PL171]
MEKVVREEVTDDAFAVADVGSIIRQHKQWVDNLPMVEPFYAVKCNPDPVILQTMVRMGTGFDCASKGEIDAVLALGVDPSRIIYANPCKAASQIRYAGQVGVRMMTFDNADELHKVKRYHPNPQMVLRIITDDSKSVCKFGVKFGAHLENTLNLLQVAKDIGVDIIGVSFHVGSGCMDAASFADAIYRARRVFNEGIQLGFNMRLLDIGGGFPGADAGHGINFHQIVAQLRPAIEEHFPASSGVRIISEPGRYYVSAAYTLAVTVHARRVVRPAADPINGAPESFMYYVNEGLYSAFNCVYYDHYDPKLQVLLKDGVFLHGRQDVMDKAAQFPCSVWGPTCDSMDVITKNGKLPELNVGDWLYVDAMGAYTVAAASTFNGFSRCQIIWTNTEAESLLV